jgi:hypothetical protein
VSDLVKQFDGMSAMMKGMAGLGMRDRLREVQRLQSQMSNPDARLGRPKGDTGKRLTADERRKQREADRIAKATADADAADAVAAEQVAESGAAPAPESVPES